MIKKTLIPSIALLIFGATVLMGCAGPTTYDDPISKDFVAELESKDIDPSHPLVNVALRAQCGAHSQTGFMENYDDNRMFILASNDRTEDFYLQNDKKEWVIFDGTIRAMRSTVDGGAQMQKFCESTVAQK